MTTFIRWLSFLFEQFKCSPVKKQTTQTSKLYLVAAVDSANWHSYASTGSCGCKLNRFIYSLVIWNC